MDFWGKIYMEKKTNFLLLRNKKAYLYGRGPGTAHMAEKIACGYFLLLRNKKTYLHGRGPGTAHMAEKIACGYFFIAPQ